MEQLKFVRFQQRRANLNDSFAFLNEAIHSVSDVRIKNAAIIKAFEMTFELCWKSLKDLLEYKGMTPSTPRDALKEAFKAGYLQDGQAWIDLLDRRNELVHVYNQEQATKAAQEIESSALPYLQKLIELLNRIQAE